jgi:hypothetical protein
VAGEFLAVDDDSLYVLTRVARPEDPVVGLPLNIIEGVKIAHFDPETENTGRWVAAGSILSLSHGMLAAISMPVWIIAGSAMAAGHSRTALENYPDRSWDELKMFARFPQGPPPGLHKLGLHPRQYTEPPPPPKTNPR